MSPGGHLVTTAVAAGVGLAATGSVPFAAGIVVGGFLIDVDHAMDYLIVERQRELTPAAFLRYYTEGRARRAVLAPRGPGTTRRSAAQGPRAERGPPCSSVETRRA